MCLDLWICFGFVMHLCGFVWIAVDCGDAWIGMVWCGLRGFGWVRFDVSGFVLDCYGLFLDSHGFVWVGIDSLWIVCVVA